MIPAQLPAASSQLALDTNQISDGKGHLVVDQAALTAIKEGVVSDPAPTTGSNDHFSILKARLTPEMLADLQTAAAPTDGGSTPAPASGGLGGVTDQIGALSNQLQSEMSQMQNLNPNDPNYLQESTTLMMQIQNTQNQIQELTSLESNLLSSEHQDAMSIINNMK